MGAAIASRVTFASFVVGAIAILLIDRTRRIGAEWRYSLTRVAFFVTPLAVTGVVLAAYNSARFGSPIETGVRWALQGAVAFYQLVRMPDGGIGSYYDAGGAGGELLLYLLSWPRVFVGWPYFGNSMSAYVFPVYASPPAVYMEHPVISVLAQYPLSIVGILGSVVVCILTKLQPPSWMKLVGALEIGAVIALVQLSGWQGMSSRYTVDFAPVFALAGGISVLAAVDWIANPASNRAMRTARPLAAGSVVASTFVAVLLGVPTGLGTMALADSNVGVALDRASNEALGQLPHYFGLFVPSHIQADGPETWQAPTGAWMAPDPHYREGAPITLKAPSDSPSVTVVTSLDQPLSAPIQLLVNGRPLEVRPIDSADSNGQIVWRVTDLEGVRSGDLVDLSFRLLDGQDPNDHSTLPLIVTMAGLASS
jgi:hypothetical protein